jgi:predicted lipoprotein with Yx(FWY)xxD motif
MRTITASCVRNPPPHGAGATHALQRTSLLLAIALSTAACNPQQDEATVGGDTTAAENATAADAAQPGAPPMDEVRSAANQAPGEEPTVLVSQTAPLYLVDASGNALYALEGNQDGSKCDADCESAWPPVVAHASRPSSAPGMQPGMLGALPREGGSLQLTYDGNPLYRYAGDMGAASTAGQGVSDKWGQWHLVGADGAFVKQAVDGPAGSDDAPAPSGTAEDGANRPADADAAGASQP